MFYPSNYFLVNSSSFCSPLCFRTRGQHHQWFLADGLGAKLYSHCHDNKNYWKRKGMLYSPLLKQEEKWFKLTFAKTFGTVARDRGKNWPVGSTATKRVKSNRLRLAKQQLCTCITLYLHFFAVTARLRCKNAQFHVFNITSIEWTVLRLFGGVWDGLVSNGLYGNVLGDKLWPGFLYILVIANKKVILFPSPLMQFDATLS